MKNHFTLFISYAILKIIFYFNGQLRFIPEIVFLDVGQGDAILITTPEKKKILVDGGAGFTVSQRLNSYFPLNDCKLDAIFLTHPHADHLEGLNRVLENCQVGRVFYTSALYESGLFEEWEEKVSSMGFSFFGSGDVYIPDKSGKIKFYGVWPPEEYIGKSISNINNVSTVMFFDSGDFEFLLTGDAEQEVLTKINLVSGEFHFLNGLLEVYKLSHHGAKNGFNTEFWQNLNPLFSVISVGEDNKFGHPHEEVIEWLDNRGVKYGRTDVEGTIKIRYNSL